MLLLSNPTRPPALLLLCSEQVWTQMTSSPRLTQSFVPLRAPQQAYSSQAYARDPRISPRLFLRQVPLPLRLSVFSPRTSSQEIPALLIPMSLCATAAPPVKRFAPTALSPIPTRNSDSLTELWLSAVLLPLTKLFVRAAELVQLLVLRAQWI